MEIHEKFRDYVKNAPIFHRCPFCVYSAAVKDRMRHHLELSHSSEAAERGARDAQDKEALPVISSSYTISGASFNKPQKLPVPADEQPEEPVQDMVEKWCSENVGSPQRQNPAATGLRPILAATRRGEDRAQLNSTNNLTMTHK